MFDVFDEIFTLKFFWSFFLLLRLFPLLHNMQQLRMPLGWCVKAIIEPNTVWLIREKLIRCVIHFQEIGEKIKLFTSSLSRKTSFSYFINVISTSCSRVSTPSQHYFLKHSHYLLVFVYSQSNINWSQYVILFKIQMNKQHAEVCLFTKSSKEWKKIDLNRMECAILIVFLFLFSEKILQCSTWSKWMIHVSLPARVVQQQHSITFNYIPDNHFSPILYHILRWL